MFLYLQVWLSTTTTVFFQYTSTINTDRPVWLDTELSRVVNPGNLKKAGYILKFCWMITVLHIDVNRMPKQHDNVWCSYNELRECWNGRLLGSSNLSLETNDLRISKEGPALGVNFNCMGGISLQPLKLPSDQLPFQHVRVYSKFWWSAHYPTLHSGMWWYVHELV